MMAKLGGVEEAEAKESLKSPVSRARLSSDSERIGDGALCGFAGLFSGLSEGSRGACEAWSIGDS